MSYENAPATDLVATHCAVCNRPLLDAESVRLGIGPDCRRKHGYDAPQAEVDRVRLFELALEGTWPTDPHAMANALVHRIALDRRSAAVPRYIAALDALGYGTIARRIASRLGAIVVDVEGDQLIVQAPYSEAFNLHARRVPGAYFDRQRTARVVPASSKRALWEALRRAFEPGTLVLGTKVAFL